MDRERIERLLADLRAGREGLLAQLHEQNGAIKALELLLAEDKQAAGQQQPPAERTA